MATSRTPSRGPGSSYNLTPSPSPCRTQFTFSTQRAEFTKPVPAALLPVYPTFAQDLNSSDADDEASMVNKLTKSVATPQGQKDDASATDWNSQIFYRDVDTMATARQAALMRAEKSGTSSTSISTSLSLNTADFDMSLGKIDNMKVQPENHSNSVMARFASFLGLKNRRKSASNASVSLSDVSLPAPSPFKDPKYSPMPRSDFLRSSSSLSFSNSLWDDRNTNMLAVIEDDRDREQLVPLGQANKSKRRKRGQDSSYISAATYPPPVRPIFFPRHLRSRSLDISRAHLHQASLIPFAEEVSPPHSRSRSMDIQSRYGQITFRDCSLRVSSSHPPPLSTPPNCVLVQVWAVGLDESDRRLVVGSDGCVIDGAHNFESSQGTPNRKQTKRNERRQEAIGYSIFDDPKMLGWSSEFRAKNETVHGWFTASSVKPLSDQRTTQNYNGTRIAQIISPKPQQLLEAECFPGQSFVGRVLEVGSVVEKSFATRGDWVIGLIDIRKVSLLLLSSLKFQSVNKRLVWRVG